MSGVILIAPALNRNPGATNGTRTCGDVGWALAHHCDARCSPRMADGRWWAKAHPTVLQCRRGSRPPAGFSARCRDRVTFSCQGPRESNHCAAGCGANGEAGPKGEGHGCPESREGPLLATANARLKVRGDFSSRHPASIEKRRTSCASPFGSSNVLRHRRQSGTTNKLKPSGSMVGERQSTRDPFATSDEAPHWL